MTKLGWIRYKDKKKKRTEDANGDPLLDCEWGGYYVGRVGSRRRRHTTGNDNQRTIVAGINPGQNNPYSNHLPGVSTPVFTQPWPGTGNRASYASRVPAHNSQNSNLPMHNSNARPPYQKSSNAAGSKILMQGSNSFQNPNNSKDNSSWAAAQRQQQQQQATTSSRDKPSTGNPMSNISAGLSHIPQKESDRANPVGSEVGNNHRTYVIGMVGQNTKKMIDRENNYRRT